MKTKPCKHGNAPLSCYACRKEKGKLTPLKKYRERKCKNCGDKFVPKIFGQHFCIKIECVTAMWKDQKDKEWRKQKKKLIIENKVPELKNKLQTEIQALARAIDAAFGITTCIDCDVPFGAQVDGAHYHAQGGGHSNIRFHLHNIHSARSDCNQHSPLHHSGYAKGLAKRYGKDYLDYIETLPIQYGDTKLTGYEVEAARKITRQLTREIKRGKRVFKNEIVARTECNKLIGIYKGL